MALTTTTLCVLFERVVVGDCLLEKFVAEYTAPKGRRHNRKSFGLKPARVCQTWLSTAMPILSLSGRLLGFAVHRLGRTNEETKRGLADNFERS